MGKKIDVSGFFMRMRERDMRRKAANPVPDEPCRKCGETVWESCEEEASGCWYCFKCGNRAYRMHGELVQGGRRGDGNG